MRIVVNSLLALVIALVAVTGYYTYQVLDARRDTAALVSAAFARHGSALDLTGLAPEREAMLLAIQDPAFRRHHGVDLTTPGAGLTTLTQALVKQLYYPNGFRPGVAKIRQTLIAQYALDALVSKDEQLRLFLNIAYLGHEHGQGVHGFAEAARVYFGKGFADLTDEEYLTLVAMLNGPNLLKPGTAANRARVERIRRYVLGEYHPAGLRDVEYRGVARGAGLAERGLVALLRAITVAPPE